MKNVSIISALMLVVKNAKNLFKYFYGDDLLSFIWVFKINLSYADRVTRLIGNLRSLFNKSQLHKLTSINKLEQLDQTIGTHIKWPDRCEH